MPTAATSPTYQPTGYHSVTTYITVDDFQAARTFYEQALGARLTHEPIIMDDGRVGHAEMTFGDTVLMISEAFPEIGVVTATSLGGSPFMLTYWVPDADAIWQRAVDAGATASVRSSCSSTVLARAVRRSVRAALVGVDPGRGGARPDVLARRDPWLRRPQNPANLVQILLL